MESLALCFVSLVGGYIIGSFLPSYFKKKGENLATKEDIAELTKTAKEIEAKINEGVWERQRQWELKREALLEGGRAIADFLAAIIRLNAIYATKQGASQDEETQYLIAQSKQETDALDAVNKATYSFQRAQLIVSIIGGKELQIAFVKTERLYKKIAVKITEGDTEYLNKAFPELRSLGSKLTLTMRRELGFDDSEFTTQPQ
jgi:hypothetical protein